MTGLLLLAGFFAVVIAMIVGISRLGKLTNVSLLPHQRGVLFRQGKPVRDLAPGKYRVWAGRELVVHGDVRPISVNYENLVVALPEGFAALYGFSASVQVSDFRKAMYRARDFTQVPASILLRCARRQLHLSPASAIRGDKEGVANRINQAAKTRLAEAGFDLVSFRLPQLVLGTTQPANPQTKSGSNSPTV